MTRSRFGSSPWPPEAAKAGMAWDAVPAARTPRMRSARSWSRAARFVPGRLLQAVFQEDLVGAVVLPEHGQQLAHRVGQGQVLVELGQHLGQIQGAGGPGEHVLEKGQAAVLLGGGVQVAHGLAQGGQDVVEHPGGFGGPGPGRP